jgi:myosin V
LLDVSCLYPSDSRPLLTHFRLSPNQIQKLLNQYLVADYEQPINGEIMKAVASRVTEKSDVLLLPAVDMEDSGPYEIAEPRVITALETYTPSWLQTPRLKRLAEIVSAQAIAQQEKMEFEATANGHDIIEEDDLAASPDAVSVDGM